MYLVFPTKLSLTHLKGGVRMHPLQNVVSFLIYPGREFRCFQVKIEESEKADSHWEVNPGHLACACSGLLL